MIRSLLLLSSIILLCCFNTTSHSTAIVVEANDSIRQGPCAVFVAPTSAQIDSLKSTMKTKDFFAMADNNMMYMSGARQFILGKKIPTYDVEATGSMKFKKKNGSIVEQKLSSMTWGVILFNGKSDPIIANMVGIENDYTRYMK
jgi:hypothetical protein